MADIRVLLCDDDPDLLGLLTRRLQKLGFEHDVAADGRLAISLVEQNTYDVIVTDIYMPEATGLEVLQFAKQRDPDIQVVIITSSATLDNAIDALNHGAFGYLTKPFDHLIVFDNMVSRAVEYRHLLVANKHKAEAQKRRGDMLEDEVAQRVQQIQKKQKGLLDLLGSLPDGILVVEEGGKVILSSPLGERWLNRDAKAEEQPIHAFISQVNSSGAERTAKARVEDHDMQLIALDFPAEGDIRRKAVIIREIESDGIGAGSLVTETVLDIKKGLATLYKQGVGTEAVLNLANQFAVLEQLAGWSQAEGRIQDSPLASQPAVEPKEHEASPELKSAEEPDGPSLSTAELSEALRAASDTEAEPVESEPAVQQASSPEPAFGLLDDLASHGFPSGEGELVEPAPQAAPPASVEPRPEPEPRTEPQPEAAPEPTFPSAQPSEADHAPATIDTGLFRPRVIPEAMSTKLGEPPPIQPSNGKRRPIRIGSSAADTQIFRRVLEKMSGETVIGLGEPEPELAAAADEPRSRDRVTSQAENEELEPTPDPDSVLRRLADAAEPALVAEAIPEPGFPSKRPRPAKPKESGAKPAHSQSAPSVPPPSKLAPSKPASPKRAAPSWPPTLPSDDPEWEDSLETKA
ncbi:MAG: response regulator [Anaerolineales bacterium]